MMNGLGRSARHAVTVQQLNNGSVVPYPKRTRR